MGASCIFRKYFISTLVPLKYTAFQFLLFEDRNKVKKYLKLGHHVITKWGNFHHLIYQSGAKADISKWGKVYFKLRYNLFQNGTASTISLFPSEAKLVISKSGGNVRERQLFQSGALFQMFPLNYFDVPSVTFEHVPS